MLFVKQKKKNSSALTIILIVAGAIAALAAAYAAFMLWKSKCCKDKRIEEEIDAAIDAAFAEEDADVEVEIIEA